MQNEKKENWDAKDISFYIEASMSSKARRSEKSTNNKDNLWILNFLLVLSDGDNWSTLWCDTVLIGHAGKNLNHKRDLWHTHMITLKLITSFNLKLSFEIEKVEWKTNDNAMKLANSSFWFNLMLHFMQLFSNSIL